MKRLLLLFTAIVMASTGMWAETVDYLYPVYNTEDDPTSGIKEWKTASVDATVVEDAATPVTWGTAGTETWYVVTGTNVTLSKGAICNGDVHLILADGAILTVGGGHYVTNAGIQVSGDGNSLTIYGQTAQTGKLIATSGEYAAGIGGGDTGLGSNITINGGMVTATGGDDAAGIGGGNFGSGSNITINGGTVIATGGGYAAGIGGGNEANGSNITINGGTVTANGGGYYAAGIGGGSEGLGSNITINGGMVMATGGYGAAAIGGGNGGGGSNIRVATTLLVKADHNNPPTTEIDNDGGDIAWQLAGQPHAAIVSILPFRDAAIAAIDAAFEGITNENMKAIANNAKTSIEAATTTKAIDAIKEKALADLQYVLSFYNAGKTDAFGPLGTKQNGPAIIVTDQDDKQIILYSPKKVQYVKVNDK